jgi:hypothetical protein
MRTIRELEIRRERILDSLGRMRCMRKGTVSAQRFAVVREGRKTDRMRGPYFVWTWKEKKKTRSRRMGPGPELERLEEELANQKRFGALCREFEELTRQLGDLEWVARGDLDATKKNSRSRWSRTKR